MNFQLSGFISPFNYNLIKLPMYVASWTSYLSHGCSEKSNAKWPQWSYLQCKVPQNSPLYGKYWNTCKCLHKVVVKTRGSVRSTRGLGPTMTARGQSIGISIGMLPQTLIMLIMVQKTSKYYTTEFDLEEGFFKRSMYQHFQFTGEYSLTNS